MTGWPSKSCGRQRPLQRGQRMVGGHDRHQGFAQHDAGLQEGRVERRSRQADVELAAADAVDLGQRHPLGQQHLDVGQRRSQPPQQRPQDRDRRDGGEAQPHDPGSAGVDAAGQVAGALDEVEQPVGLVQEGSARTGQLDPAVVALEQLRTDGLLQLLDLTRQRGLRHAQPFGRPSEVQLLRDGDEAPHLIEGDRHAGKVSSHATSGLDEHRGRCLVSVVTPGFETVAERPPQPPN